MEEEETDMSLPPLIDQFQIMKEGWGDLADTETAPIAKRVTIRKRF